MLLDAIILTGGRSSRLDSIPKSEFVVDGSTLLARTLHAARDADRIVVVGTEPMAPLPGRTLLVREEPPFGGPVAAIAAGLDAFGRSGGGARNDGRRPADRAVLVLACDMPHIASAVPYLVNALTVSTEADGVLAVDAQGRRQPLAAIYRVTAMEAALDAVARNARRGDPLAGVPVFRLLDHVTLVEVPVPHDATADVDTWDDAVRLDAHPPLDQLPTIREGSAR